MKLDSVKLRQIVSSLQWSVSGVVVIAVMLLLTGIQVWDWLAWLGGLYVAFVGPASMITGMVLCWRLPDKRRYIVIPVEIFVLFCGLGLVHVQVDKATEQAALDKRKAFLASAEYTGALDTYKTAKAKWDALTARIDKVPGDFTTGADKTTKAGDSAKADFETAKAELVKIEAKAPPQPETVTVARAFELFGKDFAPWLQAIVMFLLAVGDQAVALAISWQSSKIVPIPVQEPKKRTDDEPKEAPHEPESKPRLTFGEQQEAQRTWEEYYAAAIHGRTDGRVWGREKVCEALGISERQGRKLYAECIEKGKIIPAPPSAPKVGVDNTQ